MKTRLFAALLVALSASVAAPAFASGNDPAPFDRPSVGASASQRGQSTETIPADRSEAINAHQGAYGGVIAGYYQSGSRESVTTQRDLFAHH
jgi:hypothetical protein